MSSPPSSNPFLSIKAELDTSKNDNESQLRPPIVLGKMAQGQKVKSLSQTSILSEEDRVQTTAQRQIFSLIPEIPNLNLAHLSIPTIHTPSIPLAQERLSLLSPTMNPTHLSDSKPKKKSQSHKTSGSKLKKNSKQLQKDTSNSVPSSIQSTNHSTPTPQINLNPIISSSSFPLTNQTSMHNQFSKQGAFAPRSLSLPLKPSTSQQHIHKQHIITAGSISDRSPYSEIGLTYHLTRPTYTGVTDSPTPKLTGFLSSLDSRELYKLERRFKLWQMRQQSSMVQQIPESSFLQEESVVTTSQSITSTERQIESSKTFIDENAISTLKEIPEVLEQLLKIRKQVNWDQFIPKLAQKLPDAVGLILQILSHKIQARPSRLEEHTLAETLTEVLLRLESHELLKHQEILKKIKFLYVELYILIHTQLKRACIQKEASHAELFVDMILTEEDHTIVYCHHWITSTSSFAQALYDHLCSCENTEQLSLLIETTKLLLNMQAFHPLPISVISCFDTLARQKSDLIFQDLKTSCWLAIRPFLPNSRSNHTASNKQVASTKTVESKKKWSEIEEKIDSHKVEASTINRLAWDLTNLDAHYFIQITPQELVLWSKQPNKALAIQTSISYFNILSNLAQSQILKSSDPETRAQYCEFFIQLSKRLIDIGNLNSAYSLLSAFNAAPINRLKQTWSNVKENYQKEKEELDQLFSTINNFENYHTHIQTYLNSPTHSSEICPIPAVSLLLFRLRFIADIKTVLTAESTDNSSETKLLNFHKFSLLSKQCQMFQQFHQNMHQFLLKFPADKTHFDIASKLEETSKFQDEDSLWALSEQYEPFQKGNPSSQRKKRLSLNLTSSLRGCSQIQVLSIL